MSHPSRESARRSPTRASRGEPFAVAWKLALATVRPSAEMRALLAETQDAWRRAHDDEPPTRSERAAGQLIDALDRKPVAA